MMADNENASIKRVDPDKSKDKNDKGSSDDKGSKKKKFDGDSTEPDSGKSKPKGEGSDTGEDTNTKDTDPTESEDSTDEDGLSDDGGGESGDSSDDGESDSGSKAKKKKNPGQLAKKAMQVIQAAQLAMKAITLAKIIAFLKMLLQMIMNIINGIIAAIQAIIAAIVTAITAIAAAIGVAVVVVATGIIGLFVLAIIVVVVVVSSATSDSLTAQRDYLDDDCRNQLKSVQFAALEGNFDEIQMEMGGKVYSFFIEFGLDERQVAGILGNWTTESGVDPTGVETIYNEKYAIGERKATAMEDLNVFTYNTVFDAYAAADISISKSAYKASDDKYYCGLGLGQWTGERGKQLLEFAEGLSLEWYVIDTQLAFMVTDEANGGDSQARVTWLSTWEMESSTADAATSFARVWEGNTTMAMSDRIENAERWTVKFAEMEVDVDYANSIMAMVQNAALNAGNATIVRGAKDCAEYQVMGNGSIAEAAVSYAYETRDQGLMNDGTELYQFLHEAIFPGDPYFMSCDRGVATAVRWAGADDAFPAGNTNQQLVHVAASSKWEEITWTGSMDCLEPGDVLVQNGHIVVYVSNELIKAKYPDAPDNVHFVSASLGTRSPTCAMVYPGSYEGVYYNIMVDGRPIGDWYYIYRNVIPETDSQYIAVAEGAGTLSATTGTEYDSTNYGAVYEQTNGDEYN